MENTSFFIGFFYRKNYITFKRVMQVFFSKEVLMTKTFFKAQKIKGLPHQRQTTDRRQNKRASSVWRKFWSSFFKSLRGGGLEALLALRRARNHLSAFLFC
jgi:hypothetical protein